MPNIKTNARSFAGGEVTPEFWGRIDDAKFQTGLALCQNFIALPHGPVANRAGTQFVREVKTSARRTRLIPFAYSSTQTLVLELGHHYIRMHTNGATVLDGSTPYEVATPFDEADLFDLHYVQSADVLTIVHPNYAPRELRRLGPVNWVLNVINFAPLMAAPASVKVSAKLADSPNNLRTYFYKVTAVSSDGSVTDESLASTASTVTPLNITGATQANPCVVTLDGDPSLTTGQRVTISGVLGMTALNAVFTVEAFTPATTPSWGSPIPATVTLRNGAGVVDSTGFSSYTSGGTFTPDGVQNNLLQTGSYNTITWSAVTGASRYKVYKEDNGLYGYIGETVDTTFKDDNIAGDLSITPPQSNLPFNGAGDYPGAVSYHQQRRVFAGTTNRPQNLWMSRTGTESNMTYSLPTRDDDAIGIRVASREANVVRHIVPMQDLLLLTSSAEWRVSALNSDAITPSTIAVKPQSYIGANNVPPVIVNNTMLFASARGGHMRELAYNWQAGGFLTGDVSIRAPHLFDGLTVVDLAYAKAPVPIVWAVSSSGLLLGMTYVPEQQVGAWHRHSTQGGVFESCCVVAEGEEDVLYVVVQRQINGASMRYVERMHTRRFTAQADAYFVDCGLTYSGAPADTISGLDHLEGATVSILADGAVHPQRVVTDGSVQLDIEASTIHIGLPITADLQTLPLMAQIDGAFGQGKSKNVNKVWLRVYRSSGIFAGPSLSALVEAKQRTTEPYGSPPALKTEEVQIVVSPNWGDGAQLYVRQADPLPLTVVSMTLEVAIGG